MTSEVSEPRASALVLYHTAGCHLCELAEAILVPLAAARGIGLLRVDIADDDALLERYGTRIPVVCKDGVDEDLGWPFSPDSAGQWLDRVS